MYINKPIYSLKFADSPYKFDRQSELNRSVHYKTKIRGYDELGLSPVKARELRSYIAKEQSDRINEHQMIVEEISEKLPVLIQNISANALMNSRAFSNGTDRTLITPHYSTAKDGNSNQLKVPDTKRQLKQREKSFDLKRNSSILDESYDIRSQSFLEPSIHHNSSMIEPSNKDNLSESRGRQTPYGRTPSPFREKPNFNSNYSILNYLL